MLLLTTLSLLLTAAPPAAERSARELIKAEGSLALSDGASFFVFKADGTFESFPDGMSGRTLKGTWKAPPGEDLLIEVIAVQSWMNGGSIQDDYRKLVFAIYSGKTRPFTGSGMGDSPKRVFEGYWLLQELTKTAKPKK
jgi:hypothetical protein